MTSLPRRTCSAALAYGQLHDAPTVAASSPRSRRKSESFFDTQLYESYSEPASADAPRPPVKVGAGWDGSAGGVTYIPQAYEPYAFASREQKNAVGGEDIGFTGMPRVTYSCHALPFRIPFPFRLLTIQHFIDQSTIDASNILDYHHNTPLWHRRSLCLALPTINQYRTDIQVPSEC